MMLMPQMHMMGAPAQPQQQPPKMGAPAQPQQQTPNDEDAEAERCRRRAFMNTTLSKSFKTWGGEERPISRSLRAGMLEFTFDSLDVNLVAELSNESFDKLFYVLYGVRPDSKLAACNLTNARMSDVMRVLQKSRARIARSQGAHGETSLSGVADDLSNLDHIAAGAGWQDSWFRRKVTKQERDAKKNADKATTAEAKLDRADSPDDVRTQRMTAPTVPRPMTSALPLRDASPTAPMGMQLVRDEASSRVKLVKADGSWSWRGQVGELVEWCVTLENKPALLCTMPGTPLREAVRVRLDKFLQMAHFTMPLPQQPLQGFAQRAPPIAQSDGGNRRRRRLYDDESGDEPTDEDQEWSAPPAPRSTQRRRISTDMGMPAHGPALRASYGVCAICQDDLYPSDSRTAMPCSHVFHTDCVTRYQQSTGLSWDNACPYKCARTNAGASGPLTNAASASSRRSRNARAGGASSAGASGPPSEPIDATEAEIVPPPETLAVAETVADAGTVAAGENADAENASDSATRAPVAQPGNGGITAEQRQRIETRRQEARRRRERHQLQEQQQRMAPQASGDALAAPAASEPEHSPPSSTIPAVDVPDDEAEEESEEATAERASRAPPNAQALLTAALEQEASETAATQAGEMRCEGD